MTLPFDDGLDPVRCSCCRHVRDELVGGWFCRYRVALVEVLNLSLRDELARPRRLRAVA